MMHRLNILVVDCQLTTYTYVSSFAQKIWYLYECFIYSMSRNAHKQTGDALMRVRETALGVCTLLLACNVIFCCLLRGVE